MKLKKEEYSNREEKVKDFWLGVAIFISINTLMILIWLLVARTQNSGAAAGNNNLIYQLLICLPFLINLGLLFFFGSIRTYIAFGMLSVIGVLMALAALAGVIFMVYCFVVLLPDL